MFISTIYTSVWSCQSKHRKQNQNITPSPLKHTKPEGSNENPEKKC